MPGRLQLSERLPEGMILGGLRSPVMQICKFGFVGGVQLLADCALFVLMTWLGLGVILSSLVSRSGGAALGFWLNGRYTFSDSVGGGSAWP